MLCMPICSFPSLPRSTSSLALRALRNMRKLALAHTSNPVWPTWWGPDSGWQWVMTRDVNGYPGSRDPNLLPEPGKLSTRNNTRTYPIPGSGPIQLARARYQTTWRSVAESPAHCTNVPQHTWPIKLCCEAWTAWRREIADWQADLRRRRCWSK